jgi:hypothetical protein
LPVAGGVRQPERQKSMPKRENCAGRARGGVGIAGRVSIH